MSIYQDAKHIANTNQAKSQGILGRLLSSKEEPQSEVSRNKVIELLTGLQNDEWSHIKRAELALLQINIEPE